MIARTQGVSRSGTTGSRTRGGHQNSDDLLQSDGLVEYQPFADSQRPVVVVLDRRSLIRDCLVRCLKQTDENCIVLGYANPAEWLATSRQESPALILLCIQGRKPTDTEAMRELSILAEHNVSAPVVILSDIEDVAFIVSILESGARGYIPTSLALDVALEAMHFVEAGGIFAPASSLISWTRNGQQLDLHSEQEKALFTVRQAAVLGALRRGKANKQIAHELNMREGTVKVHIRHIMKKLKARNRTEAVVLANGLFAGTEHG